MTATDTSSSPLAFDDPEAYIAGDRRRALADGLPLDGRVQGAALFADISGFTPLTQALADELGAHRGAEELSVALDRIVGAVLGELHRFGGDAISFSGDAVTCWIDGDDGRAAVACALAMQQVMEQVGTVVTPAGRSVTLGMKVAVAAGRARRFVVGDPAVQLLDVLAGGLLDDLAAAEQQAQPGEVVVDAGVVSALGLLLDARERRSGDRGEVTVVSSLEVEVPDRPQPPQSAPLPEDVVRQWLLPPVWDRLRAGRGEFLTELRPAVPLFLRLGGLDFDADDSAPAELDEFVVRAQRIVDDHGGSTLQLTVGDKGAYLYAVFGSPLAHEDDAARACASALELLELDGLTRVRDLQIGVAVGRLRSGTYGHRDRRTFCCLGDSVNLAARLMAKAPAGQAWVSEQAWTQAGEGFVFEELPVLHLKGKRPVTAARVVARARRSARAVEGALIGRGEELAALLAEVASSRDGGGRVVGVVAEAGTGKSRLVEEVASRADAEGVRVVQGAAQAFGATAAYSAWRDVFATLLGVEGDPEAAALEEHLAQAIPAELLPRLPLVGTLLGVPLADTPLTSSFSPELRKTSLEQLAVDLLKRAAAGPLLLVLEDCHWLDPLSRDLLLAAARELPNVPLTVLLAYRTGDEPLLGLGLDRLAAPATEVVLGPLEPDAAGELVRQRLVALYGADAATPSDALVAQLAERSEGNPLYVCELSRYLHERGLDPSRAVDLEDSDLPDSLQSLVLSRVDGLAEGPRRTAKVASVAGRVFAPAVVVAGYPELGSAEDVDESLAVLSAADVTQVEDPISQTWAFSHGVVRDVAYESLPFAMRLTLHTRIGEALESGVLGDAERQLDALAHHYWRGEDDDKKRTWLLRAGIASQAGYANAAALQWYERLLPLLPPAEQPPVLLRTGKVLELGGRWAEAEAAYSSARELSLQHDDSSGAAWAQTWLAEVARKQGRYDESARGFTSAAAQFAAVSEDKGVAQVQHLAGTLAAQRGDYVEATRSYTASLAVRERLGDLTGMASLLSNLAIVAEYQGDYDEAMSLGERALALRTEAGDTWGIGISHNNLGMLAVLRGDHEAARERFTESMRLHTEVGDTWMVALGHNNLGNAYRGLGATEDASRHYLAALHAYRGYADDWALAILYEDVAQLAAGDGDGANALRLVGAADAVRERLGSPRAPDVQGQLDACLEPVASALAGDAGSLVAEGRAASPDEADAVVVTVCSF